MLNNAFVTVQIKDLWSANAKTISKTTDKMSRSIERFEKQFGSTANKMNTFTQKMSNAGNQITKFKNKYNEVKRLKTINLSNFVKGNLTKEIDEVKKLREEIKKLKNTESKGVGGQPAKGGKGTGVGGMVGGVLSVATGMAFTRSAIKNATEFDSALYDINRQLGENENIQDYINFIEEYSLATGRNNVEVAQQTAELRKTLKAGEGLDTIRDKMQLMTFAVNQLEVDSITSAKSIEIIGKAFNLSTDGMKAFFSQANNMEDFYGALVTGGDLLEIISRMPITLMKNTKLMSKESTLMLATFAKANTSLDASAVGYNLGKVLEGGRKAKGGGIIASAEREGKTIEEYLFKIRDEFGKLKTVASQNDFIEMIAGTNDLQAKDVFRSLLTEIGKIDIKKVTSFKAVQKQFENGKISSIEYRKEIEKLNEAEKTFVSRTIGTEQGLKEFNRTIKMLGDTHEATLGRIDNAWNLISGKFGDKVLFPSLNVLADGLEKVTPFITQFITNEPLLSGAFIAVAGALTVLKTATLWFGGAKFATALGMLTKLSLIGAGLSATYLAIKYGIPTAQKNMQANKDVINAGMPSALIPNKTKEDFVKTGGMSIPTPMNMPQFQPKGAIDVNVTVNGQAQVETDVKKQDNIFLNLFPTTTTRTL